MTEFIEVKRVLSDSFKNNTGTQPELINIADIQTARGWHKGEHDLKIKGEMTILLMRTEPKPEPKVKDVTIFNETPEEKEEREREEKEERDRKPKPKTILIEENYRDFVRRMSAKVIVRQLSDVEAP